MVGNGRHGGTRAVMDHIEGSLRVVRLSHETEPEPWTYEISFAPYAASSIPPACDVVGDDQLEWALRYGLGLREPHLDRSSRRPATTTWSFTTSTSRTSSRRSWTTSRSPFANLARRLVPGEHRREPEGAGEGEVGRD